jgi:hypothetical protein
VHRYWKNDRITAYEAPRQAVSPREMRSVSLIFQGQPRSGRSRFATVRIPRNMKAPDIIKYRGHTFVRRTDDTYSEASMWPIVDGLDS